LRPSISIVIPAYNEEKRLPKALPSIREYLGRASWEFAEIVVVDDGSADRTAELALASGARVVKNPGNRGKGYSVKHGVREARGDWLLITDADLSAPIADLDRLWDAAQVQNAQVAIGSRAVDRSLVGIHQPFFREAAGRCFNLVMRIVTGLPFRDTQCGFKLFEARAAREIFKRQQLDGFGFDVEVLFIARQLGYRAIEVAVHWNDVPGTTVSLTRGAAAFLADPLRVRWNGIRGRYR
jgi:dolichyl-phosphate beta-glucosyltransferase